MTSSGGTNGDTSGGDTSGGDTSGGDRSGGTSGDTSVVMETAMTTTAV